MAAPFVAGTVALMFQACGRKLPTRRTRELLLKVSEPVPGEEPQRRWGSGYVNVLEAVSLARQERLRVVPPTKPVREAMPRWAGEPNARLAGDCVAIENAELAFTGCGG
jgi:hypothetical protein